MTGALIILAKVASRKGKTKNTNRIIIEGLFTTMTNVDFDNSVIIKKLEIARAERAAIFPDAAR